MPMVSLDEVGIPIMGLAIHILAPKDPVDARGIPIMGLAI